MMNFTVRQLNSPFDDSVFFLRNVYRKRAFLLDCGKLGGLEHSEVLDLGDIFISHTHMDHFVGFDRILRGALNGGGAIRMFGAPGFIGNVDGKFRSYVWNLVDGYEFSVT
ncbi:MAG: ribonuclease Z, partial [Deferribacteraceae bacterium]|nr:ribonuclease Z [Deferribacteraceae bacterium]